MRAKRYAKNCDCEYDTSSSNTAMAIVSCTFTYAENRDNLAQFRLLLLSRECLLLELCDARLLLPLAVPPSLLLQLRVRVRLERHGGHQSRRRAQAPAIEQVRICAARTSQLLNSNSFVQTTEEERHSIYSTSICSLRTSYQYSYIENKKIIFLSLALRTKLREDKFLPLLRF